MPCQNQRAMKYHKRDGNRSLIVLLWLFPPPFSVLQCPSGVVAVSRQNAQLFRRDFCRGTPESCIILLLLFMKLGKLLIGLFELMQIVNTSLLGALWIPVTFFALTYKLVMERNTLGFFCMYLDFFNLNFISALIFFLSSHWISHILTACSSQTD